ncbi:MAG TPA: HEAT repeat domain-containing protein [Verrucomicrobiae bacterium]|nr:HEAT repeat domain-containing protein [Verrucomicrobiae bacterium]
MLWHILHKLKSKDPEARRAAVEQLCQKPTDRALRVLRAMLEDEDVEVRRLTVKALGKLEVEQRFEALRSALEDRDGEVVQAAAAALKGGPADQLIPVLIRLLQHPFAGARGQAAQTLESFGWRPDNQEEEIHFRVAKAQFFQAAGFGVAAVPALEAALVSSSSAHGAAIVEALAHVGDRSVLRPLFQALKSADPAICIAAISGLTRLEWPEAVPGISALLRNRNAQVRVVAIEALGRFHAVQAANAIAGLLQDSAWEVRREAAETLGRLREDSAVEPLTAALSDSDTDVREAVVIALGNLKNAKAIGPLVLALKDPSSGVRRIAAATLSRIDTDWSRLPEARAAAEELKPALHDHDPGVRHFVGHLLAAMHATEPVAAPEGVIGELDPEQRRKMAVTCFLRVLSDADRDLRLAAVLALSNLAGEGAQAALVRARMDSDPRVRAAAEQALKAPK